MARTLPDNPDSSVGFLISDVSRLMRRVYDRRVEPLGLTRAQWRVLVHLYRREGISQTELAAVLEIEKPTLGRLVDRLEEKGWVERRVDERDQRARRLMVTDAVRPMIERMKVYAESVNEDSMAGLEAEQERHLIEILLAVKTNLNRLLVNGEDAPVNIPDGED
ncbi:MAG: MarR family transcriptional regulator [Pseudomonadota bacterium]|nr:MarR family transcriptional regulator [Pseudomonadota bacterium]